MCCIAASSSMTRTPGEWGVVTPALSGGVLPAVPGADSASIGHNSTAMTYPPGGAPLCDACCQNVVGLTRMHGPTGWSDASRRYQEHVPESGLWQGDLKGSIGLVRVRVMIAANGTHAPGAGMTGASWREADARVLAAGRISPSAHGDRR